MARPSTLDYAAIKHEIELKGVEVSSVNTSSGRLAIHYKCTRCGKDSKMNYVNYQKGQNPEFLCKDCQKLSGPRMDRVKSYFDSMGVPISRIDTSGKHWNIYFPCSRCGAEVKILDDYVGKNNKELCCSNCRDNNRVPTKEEVALEFTSRGSEMLSEYVNFHTSIKFRCTKCCNVGEIDLAHLRNGVNPNLLCAKCNHPDTKSLLEKTLSSKNSKLLGEFVNVETPVEVTCTNCGAPFKFHYGNYRYSKTNEAILCPKCYTMARRKAQDELVANIRNGVDTYWNNYVKEFYNIPRIDWKKYNSHHIKRFSLYPETRTSIVNGYPLLAQLHKYDKNAFYHSGDGVDQSTWGEAEKLPYHTYADFHFNDFNSKFVMEIIDPAASMDRSELYKKKMEFYSQGIFYMPVFPDELSTELKRQLLFAMIRNRLHKDFPDVYEYTGTVLRRFYARDLEIKVVDKSLANSFFELNHVSGAKSSAVNIGLVIPDSNTLVCCMGLSKPRFRDQYEWEIDRLATRFDSVVVGGASRLFSYFIKEFNPENVLSFCDLRFSSVDPTETVYSMLGFEFAGRTDPNYWYRDPKTHVLMNRLSFQKSMLKDKLEIFDPDLSEFKNMEMNGYVRIFDCGNFKYVWHKS